MSAPAPAAAAVAACHRHRCCASRGISTRILRKQPCQRRRMQGSNPAPAAAGGPCAVLACMHQWAWPPGRSPVSVAMRYITLVQLPVVCVQAKHVVEERV